MIQLPFIPLNNATVDYPSTSKPTQYPVDGVIKFQDEKIVFIEKLKIFARLLQS